MACFPVLAKLYMCQDISLFHTIDFSKIHISFWDEGKGWGEEYAYEEENPPIQ